MTEKEFLERTIKQCDKAIRLSRGHECDSKVAINAIKTRSQARLNDLMRNEVMGD